MIVYFFYALVVVYFNEILEFFPDGANTWRDSTDVRTFLSKPLLTESPTLSTRSPTFPVDILRKSDCGPGISSVDNSKLDELDVSYARSSLIEIRQIVGGDIDALEDSEEEKYDGEVPKKSKSVAFRGVVSFFYALTYPLRFLIRWTIPDVNIKEYRKYYPLTALLSIIWLGILAQGLLVCIDILGNMLKISPVLMGITIGAWGASMPTLWGSIVVSRKGLGDMAISNAMGANVFSILVGLGLPWFSYPLFIQDSYDGIQDDGILPLIIVLFANTIVYFILIKLNNYTMKYWMGYIFLLLYVVTISLCVTIFQSG
jgi:Ca2+/Na+ antiporter